MARTSASEKPKRKPVAKPAAARTTRSSTRKSKVVEEAPPKRTRKAVDDAPVKRTRRVVEEVVAKKKIEEPVAAFNPYAQLDSTLDEIEKDVGLSESSMDPSEKRLSTGNLMLDIVLGGGITAGWYTNFGHEQCCKTTGAVTILAAALNSNVPILTYMDFEGSASADYLENIIRNMGVEADIKSIFGVRDEKTGKWLVAPRVRYKSEAVAEKFFDYVAKLQRMLPDKKKIGENWYYIYEDTKENRKTVGNAYDVNYWRKTKMLRVPAADGTLQALILLDSYPAMLPEKQDVDDPNNAIATQARMFSDQLKRVKGKMRGKRIAIIGINQLRLKPMVMYGCLHGDINVNFVDGRVHTMKDIVANKIGGEVWSMNEKTNKLEPKRIVDWHYNGEVNCSDDWLKITSRNPMSASGFTTMVVTRDHEIYTDRGWVKARKLRLTDKTLAMTTSLLNGKYGQFLAGSMSADCCIVQDCKTVAHLRYQDNENPEYLSWKLDKLSSGLSFVEHDCMRGRAYHSTRSQFFASMKTRIGDRDPTVFEHSDLSLAVIYMDDGNLRHQRGFTISFKRFKTNTEKQSAIVAMFAQHGIYGEFSKANDGNFRVCKNEADVFFAKIRKYVPESMQYKLPESHRGYYKDFSLKAKESHVGEFVEITKIEAGTARLFRQRGKYDISVEDNHNYLAGSKDGGIIVHNSPDYEPCGTALQLFSDVRIKWASRALSAVGKDIGETIKGHGQLEEEPSLDDKNGVDTYRYINVRGHKNKLSRPYLEGWLRLWITNSKNEAQGFDPVFDCYAYLRATGQVEGKRSKMLLKFKGNEASKSIGWMDFKRLILGDRSSIKLICSAAGMKPMKLREKCFHQMASGVGLDMYTQAGMDARGAKASKRAEDADTSDGADDNE